MAGWKKGQTVTHAGYKGVVTKVFTDGSAVVNYAPNQKDKNTGKVKTGILTNLPATKPPAKPITNTPETYLDFPEDNIDIIYLEANRKNALEYIDEVMGGLVGHYEHPDEGELIVGKFGTVSIKPTDFDIVPMNTMTTKTLPPVDLTKIDGTPLYWRWNDITANNGRIILSELEIYTDKGVCSKITENNPRGVFYQYK